MFPKEENNVQHEAARTGRAKGSSLPLSFQKEEVATSLSKNFTVLYEEHFSLKKRMVMVDLNPRHRWMAKLSNMFKQSFTGLYEEHFSLKKRNGNGGSKSPSPLDGKDVQHVLVSVSRDCRLFLGFEVSWSAPLPSPPLRRWRHVEGG